MPKKSTEKVRAWKAKMKTNKLKDEELKEKDRLRKREERVREAEKRKVDPALLTTFRKKTASENKSKGKRECYRKMKKEEIKRKGRIH